MSGDRGMQCQDVFLHVHKPSQTCDRGSAGAEP
jgi:hypothetical protein